MRRATHPEGYNYVFEVVSPQRARGLLTKAHGKKRKLPKEGATIKLVDRAPWHVTWLAKVRGRYEFRTLSPGPSYEQLDELLVLAAQAEDAELAALAATGLDYEDASGVVPLDMVHAVNKAMRRHEYHWREHAPHMARKLLERKAELRHKHEVGLGGGDYAGPLSLVYMVGGTGAGPSRYGRIEPWEGWFNTGEAREIASLLGIKLVHG